VIRHVRLALAATAGLFLLLVPAPPAGACSCLSEPVTTDLRNASVVFVGRADETMLDAAALVTTFRVERVYKGSPSSRVRVSTAPNEPACGVPFVEGRTYAVFAHDQAGTLTTGLCSGTTDDLSSISGLIPIAQASPPARAAPPDEPAGDSRTAPIAVAGFLVALLAAASGLAVRASRRPRPIA
jgi:hypothetical protein